jgi:hypothetical protein
MTLRTRIIAFTANGLDGRYDDLRPRRRFAQQRLQKMSVEELQQRLQRLQSGQSTMSEALTARRINQIRRELARRGANSPPAATKSNSSSLSSNNSNAPLTNSGNVNREARQYLRSTGNVRQLNDRQLVDAIRQGRALLQQDGLRGRLQRQVRNTVQAATLPSVSDASRPSSRNNRQPGNTGNVNREARQYLRSAGQCAPAE